MIKGLVAGLSLLALPSLIQAQPSPELYERIEAAIDAAVNQTSGEIDYTQFVNPFIGTCKSLRRHSILATLTRIVQPIGAMFGWPTSFSGCRFAEIHVPLVPAPLSRLVWLSSQRT
jgi:hypothetical protein